MPLAALALLPVRLLNALTSRRGYAIAADIAYGDHSRQTLDVYTPERAAADAPVVVFFHGGSWDSGDKADYLFVGQSLASGGLIAVVPNYRLHPDVTFPAFVRDGASAVAWAAANRPQRPLFVAGHSAGAQIALLLALDRTYLGQAGMAPDVVAGAIGLSGPYDFLPLVEERYRRIFPEAARAASQPIAFAGGPAPPMLLATGDRDTVVKPGNTARLAAAVRKAGGEVAEIVYPNAGHLRTIAALARVLRIRTPPVRSDVIAFVRRTAFRARPTA